jgi:hypothetical protein
MEVGECTVNLGRRISPGTLSVNEGNHQNRRIVGP